MHIRLVCPLAAFVSVCQLPCSHAQVLSLTAMQPSAAQSLYVIFLQGSAGSYADSFLSKPQSLQFARGEVQYPPQLEGNFLGRWGAAAVTFMSYVVMVFDWVNRGDVFHVSWPSPAVVGLFSLVSTVDVQTAWLMQVLFHGPEAAA
jgi:hypothetical protein